MWNDAFRKILLILVEVKSEGNYAKWNLIIQIVSLISTILLAIFSYLISKRANSCNEAIKSDNRIKYIGDSIKEIIEIVPSIYTLNTIYSNVNEAYFVKLPEKENLIPIVRISKRFETYILVENSKASIKTMHDEYSMLLEVATVKIMQERGLLIPPITGKVYIPKTISTYAHSRINKEHLNQAKEFLRNERCKVLNTLELLAFKYWQIEDRQSSIDQEIGNIVIELLSNMFVEVAKKSWKAELPQLWYYFLTLFHEKYRALDSESEEELYLIDKKC